MWRVGVDTGGTFTDLVAINREGRLVAEKVPSTPDDPSRGVEDVLTAAAGRLGLSLAEFLGECGIFIHGTTVATNLLLEKKGARVGLITTEGFRDTLAIRRGMRDDIWDHRAPNPEVLVPRRLRIGVPGRISAQGEEIVPLDEEAVIEAARLFKKDKVEAVAVCLFNSYVNSDHERRVAAILREHWDGDWISISSEIASRSGEYERTSTTVVNCFIGPRTSRYLARLEARLRAHGLKQPLLLMQSNGGATSVHDVANNPYTLLLSGPAAAVSALQRFGEEAGTPNLISMEIGGTSCDVILVDEDRVEVADDLVIDGYHLSLTSVDIHTIGAGGGTVAGVDKSGMFFAGPKGAGAVPGPAAYGRGGLEPTLTDALLVLGRLKPGSYAGGAVKLDIEAAREALDKQIASKLDIGVEDAAKGVLRLVEQNLLHAVQHISTEKGHDIRRFTLVAGGGAGPMHGAAIGRRLNCHSVYVSRLSGAMCALGMVHADIRYDFLKTYLGPLVFDQFRQLEAIFAELETLGRARLVAQNIERDRISLVRGLSLRYVGQHSDIPVTVEALDERGIRESFEQAHFRRFGHIQPDGQIEITKVRLAAVGLLRSPTSFPVARSSGEPRPVETRRMYVDEQSGWDEVPVFDGTKLEVGHELTGPAVVNEVLSTVFIGRNDRLTVDPAGNFRIYFRE